MKNLNIGLIAYVSIIVLAVVYPILVIWALNTLFPLLAIPINIYTYIASLLLANKLNPVKFSYKE